MKKEKLIETENEKLEEVKSKSKSKANGESESESQSQSESESESQSESESESESESKSESESESKKAKLTNRKYSTLLDAAKANEVDSETLKTEAINRLKNVISAAYKSIKLLHESKTPVSDFIKMSRAEQSNKVLQISSGSLEQRLGYDRETYTSVTTPKTKDEAIIYTLLACIGWDATSRLCGIKDAPTSKKSKSEPGSTVTLDF